MKVKQNPELLCKGEVALGFSGQSSQTASGLSVSQEAEFAPNSINLLFPILSNGSMHP